VIEGKETEIDKTMIEHIADPLVHLIRNCLDHGLELPDVRVKAGKPAAGTVKVDARQEGDQIVVTIADDGRGIDPDRVTAKAIERGLITAELARSMSRREVLDLIFRPGFSTVEVATNVSGRGVGMDVVRTNLKKLNGVVELESTVGKGTTVILRVPLTMAILPVLLVRVVDEVYGVPLRSVLEILRVPPTDIHRVEGREVLSLHDRTLPLIRLASVLEVPGEAPVGEMLRVVIIATGELRFALLVDSLLGQESTVIKPMESLLRDCASIAGATISGDGRVRLVLDPAGLVNSVVESSGVH
jgi:two-component system, chemotaxis family, sensor kinase CheA